jgi:transcriptional antiterminator NusG
MGTLRNKKEKAKWYVISVPPRYENSVKKALQQRVEATESQDIIKEVLVPVQKKIIIRNGKQKVVEENIFPGYVLVNMVLNQQTWELIKNTEGVKGFVRIDKYPKPLPDSQVKAIMKYTEVKQPEFKIAFTIGEAVKINEGVFAGSKGSIQSIDEEKGKLNVLLQFLGREIPVELDLQQVEKLS